MMRQSRQGCDATILRCRISEMRSRAKDIEAEFNSDRAFGSMWTSSVSATIFRGESSEYMDERCLLPYFCTMEFTDLAQRNRCEIRGHS